MNAKIIVMTNANNIYTSESPLDIQMIYSDTEFNNFKHKIFENNKQAIIGTITNVSGNNCPPCIQLLKYMRTEFSNIKERMARVAEYTYMRVLTHYLATHNFISILQLKSNHMFHDKRILSEDQLNNLSKYLGNAKVKVINNNYAKLIDTFDDVVQDIDIISLQHILLTTEDYVLEQLKVPGQYWSKQSNILTNQYGNLDKNMIDIDVIIDKVKKFRDDISMVYNKMDKYDKLTDFIDHMVPNVNNVEYAIITRVLMFICIKADMDQIVKWFNKTVNIAYVTIANNSMKPSELYGNYGNITTIPHTVCQFITNDVSILQTYGHRNLSSMLRNSNNYENSMMKYFMDKNFLENHGYFFFQDVIYNTADMQLHTLMHEFNQISEFNHL